MKKLRDRSGESFPINITADELKNVTITTLDSWLCEMGEKPDDIKTMKRREKEEVLLATQEPEDDEEKKLAVGVAAQKSTSPQQSNEDATVAMSYNES
mmetsp:Transcript_6446/g.12147  ORF Transcript_6446/g.12147 Transcript_6446/m.12147 type:complete len:98 (+) Transcript_6446:341-634(+)